jgi:hypothetical protein
VGVDELQASVEAINRLIADHPAFHRECCSCFGADVGRLDKVITAGLLVATILCVPLATVLFLALSDLDRPGVFLLSKILIYAMGLAASSLGGTYQMRSEAIYMERGGAALRALLVDVIQPAYVGRDLRWVVSARCPCCAVATFVTLR